MSYPGGKAGAGVYQAVINQITPHDVFIDAFAGHGGIARNLRPSRLRVGVDRSPAALAEWRRAQPGATNRLVDVLVEPPPVVDVVPDAVPDAGVVALLGSAFDLLERWRWTGGEFVYLDPPYLLEATRSGRLFYDFGLAEEGESDEAAHERLLDLARSLPAPVALSGYRSDLYDSKLHDWRRIDYSAPTRGGGSTESLWLNRPAPTRLHDPRYVGKDYRERWNLTKKARRWKARFDALDPLEKLRILSELDLQESAE